MHLAIISACKTNRLRGLKRKNEYKYEMTVSEPMTFFFLPCCNVAFVEMCHDIVYARGLKTIKSKGFTTVIRPYSNFT